MYEYENYPRPISSKKERKKSIFLKVGVQVASFDRRKKTENEAQVAKIGSAQNQHDNNLHRFESRKNLKRNFECGHNQNKHSIP